TGQGVAVRLIGSQVSANLFRVLGVEAKLGRIFEAGEDRLGRDDVVILSQELWHTKFGGDSNIIGRPILIDGMARQVIGVMPPEFGFPSTKAQLWLPARFDPSDRGTYWEFGWMSLIARLRPGVKQPQALSELTALNAQISSLFPWAVRPNWNAQSTI